MTIAELKSKPNWVNWIEWSDPKNPEQKTKPPKNPYNGYNAKANDPKTWNTYEKALSKCKTAITHRHFWNEKDEKGNNKYTDYPDQIIKGVGFMFSGDLIGIDLDDVSTTPERKQQADEIINLFHSYTEVSPSGDGYHILIRCDTSKLPADYKSKYYMNNRDKKIECYIAGATNKYFTYTEQTINEFDIEDRTDELIEFLDKFMRKTTNGQRQTERMGGQSDVDIIDKIIKSKSGAKFRALYYDNDITGYQSRSDADMALCSILAWWLQGDFNEIDKYFRLSALIRSKWDEMHGAATYGAMTINKAIDGCNGNFYSPKGGRPKKVKEKKEYTQEQQKIIDEIPEIYGKIDDEKISIAAVALYLKEQGITAKYNEITKKAEIKGVSGYNDNFLVENFPVLAFNDLQFEYNKCSIDTVQNFIKAIIMNNTYNPVLELIGNTAWDGKNRLPELFRIMRIADDDRLSKTLIYKWLWQNLSLARNNKGKYGADGLLVLRGNQGIGKTTFARKMALKDEWFGEGLKLDTADKDLVIAATKVWIGELGEIESTFKSDISALKAFVTKSIDSYRAPYGRVPSELPRRTSYIGTCNSDEYLIDETGNRRFWTVPIAERMDLDALKDFDILQLYAEINVKAKYNVQGFRLTEEENTQLTIRNGKHEKILKAEWEVRDILAVAEEKKLNFEPLTVSEFKEMYSVLRNYQAEQISRALRKIAQTDNRPDLIPEPKKVDGKTQKLALLPRTIKSETDEFYSKKDWNK